MSCIVNRRTAPISSWHSQFHRVSGIQQIRFLFGENRRKYSEANHYYYNQMDYLQKQVSLHVFLLRLSISTLNVPI